MSLQVRLTQHKQSIETTLYSLLDSLELNTTDQAWGKDVAGRLRTFLIGGKMVRGSLVCLMYQMLTKQSHVPHQVYIVAAAEEIFASALLIHDDIMDRDRVRRGRASIFAQYESTAQTLDATDAEQYGYAQGIIVGDICYFWVMEIISTISIEPKIKCELQRILAQESIKTGFGQMYDVSAAMLKTELSKDDLEYLALNKTARYTFVLPFLLAATMAESNREEVDALETLGNTMGILFQIKDDELGLFGSEEETGKPEGNDIKEGKQTLFSFFTRQLLDLERQKKFNQMYGKKVTKQTLEQVREMVMTSGAHQQVQSILQEYAHKAIDSIGHLPISDLDKHDLIDFVHYNLHRKR